MNRVEAVFVFARREIQAGPAPFIRGVRPFAAEQV